MEKQLSKTEFDAIENYLATVIVKENDHISLAKTYQAVKDKIGIPEDIFVVQLNKAIKDNKLPRLTIVRGRYGGIRLKKNAPSMSTKVIKPSIEFTIPCAKPLAEVMASDVPRGLDPEDVATDRNPKSDVCSTCKEPLGTERGIMCSNSFHVVCDSDHPGKVLGDRCPDCGGDGYYKGPRLGDEPCPKCQGNGYLKDNEEVYQEVRKMLSPLPSPPPVLKPETKFVASWAQPKQADRLDLWIKDKTYRVPHTANEIVNLLKNVLEAKEDPEGPIKFQEQCYVCSESGLEFLDKFLFFFYGAALVF